MIIGLIIMLGLGVPALLALFAGSVGTGALGTLAVDFMLGAAFVLVGGFIL